MKRQQDKHTEDVEQSEDGHKVSFVLEWDNWMDAN